jgi:DNA-binding GntR family transcriptional regulator
MPAAGDRRSASVLRSSKARGAASGKGGARPAPRTERRGHRRLGESVAEELRRLILAGAYKPGERLIEDRLSAGFGVSRVPIREAIRTLTAEGLVEPTPSRGACVAALSPEFAEELVEVRALLEGMNARLAARHRRPEIVARLRAVLERGNAAARHGTAAELAELNGEFHELLAEAGSNRVLRDVIRPLRERTNLVFRRNTAERAPEDWREHAMILSAVIDGDEELAMLLATRHVRSAARARLGAVGPVERRDTAAPGEPQRSADAI